MLVSWRNRESELITFKSFKKVTFSRICVHLENKMGFDSDRDTVETVSGKAKIVMLED